jgi:hypothetical protein
MGIATTRRCEYIMFVRRLDLQTSLAGTELDAEYDRLRHASLL